MNNLKAVFYANAYLLFRLSPRGSFFWLEPKETKVQGCIAFLGLSD
jgi:hypothetical protein